ncbi:MAG: sigma 54-interacting transcriptional regulator [Verrucomicrobia subdivision 3 bacterium]|nr:sigma 54-interacting transcriptional regulator [Limisphaerales bacterium]
MNSRQPKAEVERPESSGKAGLDITEPLPRQNQDFKTRLIEASQDCIKVLDLDGRLLSMNAGGMKLLEICDFEPLRGTRWADFWHGEDDAACEAALVTARRGDVGRFVGFFPTKQTRKPLWFDVVVSAILGADGKPEKLLAVLRDVTEWKRSQELLGAIIEGTSGVTGTAFFRSLVQHLASGLHVRWAFVAECLPNRRARSLAFWEDGAFGVDFDYDLAGTPCMEVAKGRTCHVPDRLAELFPEDKGMIAMGTVSYLGVPLLNSEKRIIGHLVVFDDKPMPRDALMLSVMETFAARAGAELERQQAEGELRQLTTEMEAVLNVNRAVGQHLDRDELFGALAYCLRRVIHHDRFGIELPIEGDRLQGHLLTPSGAGAQPTRVKVLPRKGTACNWVLENKQWLISAARDELRERFPLTVEVMSHEGMESLAAMPLATGDRVRGVLYFMAAARGAYTQVRRGLVEQVAAAVAAALDNCLAHEELRQQSKQALAESEERFRDLFDEAPIAYVHEGLDTRFIRANHTAMRILGIKPEEIAGTYGKSFVPDTPEAQRRVREALESIGKGTDTRGVVLELRRKDNGKPIWIQWWSRPDPSGTYTRTMFIDITDRVLMEQEKARLEAQNTYLQEEIRTEHNFDEIVGNSPSLLGVLRQVDQVAPTDSTVLILGETGTGKELIARAIHDRSPRKRRPLVKVNCGAISAGLVESELFGHVKGAFTGALTQREGRFKLADGGTIFLDEVAELPLDTQVKLLRVLQEQEFEPVGSSETVRVSVRVIAATNRDLRAAVGQGKFRSDLYYRLSVFPLHNPPLRDRSGDVPLLVMFFLQRFARKLGRPVKYISEQTMARLTAYGWPGNIRELQNVIERAVVLSTGSVLNLGDDFQITDHPPATLDHSLVITDHSSANTPRHAPPGDSLRDVERHHIESILKETNWMIEGERGAAKILNLHPSTLRSRMQKLGIRRPPKPV